MHGLNRMSACECKVHVYPKGVIHHRYTEWNSDLVLVWMVYWVGFCCLFSSLVLSFFHLSNHNQIKSVSKSYLQFV